jgi:hypothetical protein
MKTDKENTPIFLVGDIKFTESASSLRMKEAMSQEFIIELQSLMEKFRIVKIDVAWDGLKLKRELETFNTNDR